MEFTPAIATIVAGLVAAVVALISTQIQLSLRLREWPQARETAIGNELRKMIQEFAISIAAASHSMCWLTWAATRGVETVSDLQFSNYNSDQHKVLPVISGQLAAIASLDKATYEELVPIAEELYDLDAKLGELAVEFRRDNGAAIQGLEELHTIVAPFERAVHRRIAGIASRRVEERAAKVERRWK